ncbi:hypothetical protein EDC48_106217 [Gibbsiella quercinecans]|nr:hypothetical protein EDC48_106217 [Gibbsiella quercinecans]
MILVEVTKLKSVIANNIVRINAENTNCSYTALLPIR